MIMLEGSYSGDNEKVLDFLKYKEGKNSQYYLINL